MSIRMTPMLVAFAPLKGPLCSFKITEPKPGRARLVLGAGLLLTGSPATVSPLNEELLALVAPVVVAVLVTTAWISLAAITPPSMLRLWISSLVCTLRLVAVRFIVMVEVALPELTNEFPDKARPEFVMVFVAGGVV